MLIPKLFFLCRNALIKGFSRFSIAVFIAKCAFLSVSNKYYSTYNKCFWLFESALVRQMGFSKLRFGTVSRKHFWEKCLFQKCYSVLIRGFSRFSSALLIAKCDFLSVSNKHYNTDTKCFWMVQKQSLIHLRSIRFHYRDDFKVLWNWVKWTKFYSLGLWNE